MSRFAMCEPKFGSAASKSLTSVARVAVALLAVLARRRRMIAGPEGKLPDRSSTIVAGPVTFSLAAALTDMMADSFSTRQGRRAAPGAPCPPVRAARGPPPLLPLRGPPTGLGGNGWRGEGGRDVAGTISERALVRATWGNGPAMAGVASRVAVLQTICRTGVGQLPPVRTSADSRRS